MSLCDVAVAALNLDQILELAEVWAEPPVYNSRVLDHIEVARIAIHELEIVEQVVLKVPVSFDQKDIEVVSHLLCVHQQVSLVDILPLLRDHCELPGLMVGCSQNDGWQEHIVSDH